MAESVLKNILLILNLLKKFFKEFKHMLNHIYFIIIYMFIILAMFKIFSLIIPTEPDYDYIISIGERGAVIIATIAVLTFTYSLTLDYPNKKVVQKCGKYFLKSALNFIIGMIFLIGFRDPLSNSNNILSLPEILFDFSTILMFIFFFSGFLILISSAYFFAIGITDLLKSL